MRDAARTARRWFAGAAMAAATIGVFVPAGPAAAQGEAPARKRSTDGSWVGAAAPEISVEQLLQCPLSNDVESLLEHLRGKVIVINFWSTTCASCPTVIPHINKLAALFKDAPVQFMSVMNEPEEAVRHFMSTKSEVRGWIGIDHDLSVSREYLVPGVPMCIIVNGDGLVVARCHPIDVTPDAIRDAIAGRTPSLKFMPVPPMLLPQEEFKALPLYEVCLRPAEMSKERSFTQLGGLRYRGAQLRELLSTAYQKPQQLIYSDTLLLDAKFDATVVPPTGFEANAQTILKQLIETTMNCTGREEERLIKVAILRAPRGDAKLTRAVDPRIDGGFKPGEVWGKNFSGDYIGFSVFQALGTPVMNETGLEGQYDIKVTWNPEQPGAFERALKEQLGLEVTTEERTVKLWVVERE